MSADSQVQAQSSKASQECEMELNMDLTDYIEGEL